MCFLTLRQVAEGLTNWMVSMDEYDRAVAQIEKLEDESWVAQHKINRFMAAYRDTEVKDPFAKEWNRQTKERHKSEFYRKRLEKAYNTPDNDSPY